MDFLEMRAKRNILRAYRRFKQEMLCSDKKLIWDNAEKISFVERAVGYYLHQGEIPDVFYQMAVAEPELLSLMYQVYKKNREMFKGEDDFDGILEQILLSWEIRVA